MTNPQDPVSALYELDGAMLDMGVQNMQLLRTLENSMVMLSDDDQAFIQGCLVQVGMGTPLETAQQQQIRRIANTLTHSGHNTMGDALSMTKVCQDLHGAMHTLDAEEKRILGAAIQKLNAGQKLTTEEIAPLLTIYTNKGF